MTTNTNDESQMPELRLQDEQTSVSDLQHEIRAIARRNREGEVTVHMQGTVTEWITSDVAFDRRDRGKMTENRIAKALDR